MNRNVLEKQKINLRKISKKHLKDFVEPVSYKDTKFIKLERKIKFFFGEHYSKLIISIISFYLLNFKFNKLSIKYSNPFSDLGILDIILPTKQDILLGYKKTKNNKAFYFLNNMTQEKIDLFYIITFLDFLDF